MGEYTLTPSDLMTLRISMRGGFISDGENGRLGAPFIVYVPSDRTYCLHSNGFTVARSNRGEIILALLRSERIEAGYCRSVLDPRNPVDESLMTPEGRRDLATRRAEATARARLYAEEQDATAARRAQAIDVTKLTLDDLF